MDILVVERLTPDNDDIAVEIARVPGRMRGHGYIKPRYLVALRLRETELPAVFEVARL